MLKRVKIQGYKSLVDVEVQLQPLTVLFGSNGVGKSNFLDALQFLSRITATNNLRYAFPLYRGTPLESFSFGPNGIQGLLAQERISFSIEVDIELSQAVVDEVNCQISETAGPKIIRERNKVDLRSRMPFISEKYLRYHIEIETIPKTAILRVADEKLSTLDAQSELVELLVSVDQSTSDSSQSILSMPIYSHLSPYVVALRQELANWFFYYLEPRERMRASTPLKEVRHIGMMGEELPAFLNTLRALDEAQFKAVENALHMIIPSITGIDIDVNNSGEVVLRLLEGNTQIPTSVLSEGTLRILGLLALGGAKDPPGLIGFEEPENGIHQRRLRLIASLLKNLASGDTQVIVTTHSPLLVDLIPHESLYVCRKPQGSTVIEPFSDWELLEKAMDDEEEDLSVSERIQRGDFDV
jgi:predicted ATPase